MKAKPSLSFGFTKQSQPFLRMIRDWPKRAKAVQSEFTHDAAEDVRKGILAKLPTGAEYRDYRKNLQVGSVAGMPSGQAAHILYVPHKVKSVKKIDAKNTLLYVYPKGGMKRPSPQAEVLAKFGPWPVDLLPYRPPASEARLISRRVSEGEITAIRQRLVRKRSVWSRALSEAGSKKKNIRIDKKLKTIPDIAFSALRLEFGMGGKPRAHWRPSILDLARNTIPKGAKKKNKFDKAMADPLNTDWLGWPSRTKSRIRVKDLTDFKGFQDRLGLKFRG